MTCDRTIGATGSRLPSGPYLLARWKLSRLILQLFLVVGLFNRLDSDVALEHELPEAEVTVGLFAGQNVEMM